VDAIQACQQRDVQAIKYGVKIVVNASVQRICRNLLTIVEKNGGMTRNVNASVNQDVQKLDARVFKSGIKIHVPANVQLARKHLKIVEKKNHGTLTVVLVNVNQKCQPVDVHLINNGTVILVNANVLVHKSVQQDSHGILNHVNAVVQPLENVPVLKFGVLKHANAYVQFKLIVNHPKYGIKNHAAVNVQRICSHLKEDVPPVVNGTMQHVQKNVQPFQIVNLQWYLTKKLVDVSVEINQISFQLIKFGAIRNAKLYATFLQFLNAIMINKFMIQRHVNAVVQKRLNVQTENCSVLRLVANVFQFVKKRIPVAVKEKSSAKKFAHVNVQKNHQDRAVEITDIGIRNHAHVNV
jgi:hypothetical protein